ncbi:cytochrome b/b6 domain-containing protein [Kordiimonas lacus]|uniref:Cytochrome b n=1 Tax=Kordiimonas lacus TaxID=637679 RepID=A0A1G7CC27_9PROT|nr:cytochrome b/b6 domain-containing protein [Kordiimonas lacus]SDE36290.1 Cytochrome b [Kordiimonas lacus]
MFNHMKSYQVWDRTTRLFHWVNFLSILVLIAVGLVIYNGKAFGLSTEGKIFAKEVHVYAGYVFAANLFWRLIWGFIGGTYARFSKILPFGRGYGAHLKAYRSGNKTAWLGHNPMGRLAVTALLLLMTVQAVTGLVLAGTDIYFPPFGGMIAEWVAADGVEPASLVPYAKDMVDAAAYQDMRAFRSPFIDTHEIVFFALLGLIVLHIAAVVWTEIRHGGGIVSAMFTGRKVFAEKPADAED